MGRVNDTFFERFILSVAVTVEALYWSYSYEETVCKLNILFEIKRNIKIFFSVDTSIFEEFAKLTENLDFEVLNLTETKLSGPQDSEYCNTLSKCFLIFVG